MISSARHSLFVMPGLDPGIHDFLLAVSDVDGRDKPGHDGCFASFRRGSHHSISRLFLRPISLTSLI
ncbi:MAG: hypothetical protein DI543_02105 [Bradyrhizobium icense]|nr:MAG: hypothetical protein DI543_02105 [Bradyrhizobium icense]